ncbi:helix-turn-helix domain-containing protein [Nocardia sp. alder85J]|uniref:helix-turn-helix domain-containing protein n=1 Tax=Nocardia sp. alder85J TaxID=2862949 RepID=UPI001CD5CDDF|nr:helix-turn-helix domain-containing protein [Nocardia sp. alder85J]MCX4094147.1 helix-turn-helix domain-containing protein [Nocardia sp. alder85J]
MEYVSGSAVGTVAPWQPVIELCESVAAELPAVIPEIVDRIRHELPSYRIVDRAEHEHDVTDHYRGLLTGLAGRRSPTRAEIEAARALGAERAAAGLPLHALIDAYHVGYREMWNVLLTRAQSRNAEAGAQLVSIVGMVWTWVQQSSSAAAEAYGAAVRAADATLLSLTHQFLDGLATAAPTGIDLEQLAHALTFDPAGTFQALCAPAADWPDERLMELRNRHWPGTVRCATRGNLMIALLQDVSPETVLATAQRRAPDTAFGIGLRRTGLDGATASVADARAALALAPAGGTVSFADQWLLATVTPAAHRFAVLLEPCREAARLHPELAATVRGFADNSFSLTTTARVLHVHPNTVKYRLHRWQQLTNWDVRTWEGLSASIIALGLPPLT